VLKEGDKAPKFSLESDSGARVSLDDFAGKTLVLYFYPRDSTPGCTREAQAFTSMKQTIERAGGSIVGVSRDSVKSHCGFRDKYGINFPLLSDPELTVHKAYGAWGEKVMYGKKILGAIRSTFLVKDGRVIAVFPKVKVDGHADEVLAALRGAGGATSVGARPKKAAAAGAKAAGQTRVNPTRVKKRASPRRKRA
jgi:thioredoxin-dependent peroxiredoxin